MALTLSRWIALAVTSALIVMTLALPDSNGRTQVRAMRLLPAPVRRYDVAHSEAAQAASRLRLLQLRDSVLSAVQHDAPDRDGVILAVDRGFNAALQPQFAALTSRATALSPVSPFAAPVIVAFVLDTVTMVRGVAVRDGYSRDVDYVLPQGPGTPCLVLRRLGRYAMASHSNGEPFRWASSEAPRLLGPCAFYRAFGTPGPEIKRWLTGVGLSFATSVDWVRPLPSWLGASRSMRLKGIDGEPPHFVQQRKLDAMRVTMSATTLACSAGNASICSSAFTKTNAGSGLVWANGVYTRSSFDYTFADYVSGLDNYTFYSSSRRFGTSPFAQIRYASQQFGAGQSRLLADVVHTVGPDRFGAAWRSSLPIGAAFQAAGVDLGRVTQDWVRAAYGPQQPGPLIPTAGLVWGVAIIGGALALTLGSGARRQTT